MERILENCRFNAKNISAINTKNILYISLILFFSGCSSLPIDSLEQITANKVATETAKLTLEKFYLEQAPIRSPSLSAYETSEQLPGEKFNPVLKENSINYEPDGKLLLAPGDYVIPVITYCMKSTASSPIGWNYRLSELQGTRASLIQELNQKALPEFSTTEIQTLIWGLQAGLSYEELPESSKKIFSAILPNRKNEIQESFLKKFHSKWNSISDKTNGLFPSFESSFEELVSQMGETGQAILAMQRFREEIKNNGSDFTRLSRLINTSPFLSEHLKLTSWSKINNRIYARFVTTGSFLQIGQLQIRILKNGDRESSGVTNYFTSVPISSWVADSQSKGIQPLTFSMILGTRGLLLSTEIAFNPVIGAALLTSVLMAQTIDWDLFKQLQDLLKNVHDAGVKKVIDRGNIVLNEQHTDLEKPLKDSKIIDKKTAKITKDRSDGNTREYTKSGGIEQLEKDFEKLSGESKNAVDGMPIKELPDGKIAVKRLPRIDNASNREKLPTLEIQPSKSDLINKKLRIKVRYVP